MKTTKVVKVGGKEVPPIMALTITHEKIWSKDTGRGADGKMVGDIVAKKWKLAMEFSPMNDEQVKHFEEIIDDAFFDVEFTSPKTGKKETIKAYAGTPEYPVYSYVEGLPRYVGAKVDFIEQ